MILRKKNMENRCYCEISRSLISHNIQLIQSLIPDNTKVLGIVKANGYGIGYEELAKVLQKCGVEIFAVASLKEAIELRELDFKEDILILGHTPTKDIPLLKKYNLIQSVFSYQHAKELSVYQVRTHIKLDTGMSRMGVVYQSEDKRLEELIKITKVLNHIEGIFTHFSVSDSDEEQDIEFSLNQVYLFNECVELLKEQGITFKYQHIANSYGIVNFPELNYDYVRPGILLLGAHSSYACFQKNEYDFKPVLTWKCRVGLVKEIKKGTPISYGRTKIADKDMKVATITCGYADGYPRELSNKGCVLINGYRCLILGRVCMDQMVVDVTDIEVTVDDEVVLVGKSKSQEIRMEDLALWCNTITNDLFCRISSRVERVYYD